MTTPIKTQPAPIPVQPVRQPTPAELALKQALHNDARTHIGRMFR